MSITPYLSPALLLLFVITTMGAKFPLKRGPARDVNVTSTAPNTLELTITGDSPHFWTEIIKSPLNPTEHQVLAFDYFSPSPVKSFGVRFRNTSGEMVLAGSKPLFLAETWQPFYIDLKEAPEFPSLHKELRFHFALQAQQGVQLQIRNLRLRPINDSEQIAAEELEQIASDRNGRAKQTLQHLRDWYPASINHIQITKDELVFQGSSKSAVQLVEVPLHLPPHSKVEGKKRTPLTRPDTKGDFKIRIPRMNGQRDLSLSRWRLINNKGATVSQNHWPDAIEPSLQRDLKKLTHTHQKGLGGMVHLKSPNHQIFDLGIQHATINMVLTSLISDQPKAGWKPFPFQGHLFYLNETSASWRDETILQLSQKNIIVSCILLVGNGRNAAGSPRSLMTHPDAEARGIYSMPNLTTAKSTALYQAAIQYLAERYSRADGKHGRISNWVLHNEVNQAGTWTNMGDQPLATYVESYQRSARIVHHTSRLFDPHSRVFMSITHHWNKTSTGHGTYHARDLINLFAEFAKAEGDFEWGLAYHPYPENLRNPDTWEDHNITYDFDSPLITPKNIEVLPAYMEQPFMQFNGRTRGILLSEQGFNTPTLSEQDQKRQAAGLIYMFKKLRKLPAIEAYHLHRYKDMPKQEGGLRLGIVDEQEQPKLGWHVYKAIGTDKEKDFEALANSIIPRDARQQVRDIKPKRPNIVLIVADDLGWADTSAYVKDSPRFYHTPHLEKLASRGMRFKNAYAASPLCSPTRSSILTGQYPGRIRLTTPACHVPQVVLNPQIKKSASPSAHSIEPETRTRFPNFYVTIAERLKDIGHATAFVGKWHLGRAPYFPDQQGFNTVIGGREHPGPPGGFFAPWPIDTIPKAPEGNHIDDVITSESIKWLEAQKKANKPFFLNLWFYSVHAPLEAKPELVSKYERLAMTLPSNAPRKNPVMAAMIETLDSNVGRIVDALDRLGLTDDTLLIFTSDNGGNEYNYVAGEPATNNHPLHNGKGNIADGGQRVPFIAVWPGQIPAAMDSEALISSIDLFPTFLAATHQQPAPEQIVDGINLLPLLKGDTKGDLERSIFCHFPHSPPATGTIGATSVRQGPWKLTRHYADGSKQTDRLRLINLVNDPAEANDLSSQKPSLTKTLNQLITNHLEETKALVPIPNPRYESSVLTWTGSGKTSIKRIDGALVVSADHKDPFIKTGGVGKVTGDCSVEFTMSRKGRTNTQLYWATGTQRGFVKERLKTISIIQDGKPHTYRVDLHLGKDQLKDLRIDPTMEPGVSAIHSIRLIQWNEPGKGITKRLWEF
ncbi:DUF5722 domain-containing protein [Verrucomicrobia bacterium]|nr:DUF5722 domain-containing protein [Verrucomicrobiota bacterium]